MASGQNTQVAIGTIPSLVTFLAGLFTPMAQQSGAPNDVKHSNVSTAITAGLAVLGTAAPIVEAANPQYALVIDASIKSAVALYNYFGWPQSHPATPPAVVVPVIPAASVPQPSTSTPSSPGA